MLRNKAKNALSLAEPFSLGMAGANIDKIWIWQDDERKKMKFYEKYCVHNQKMIVFA